MAEYIEREAAETLFFIKRDEWRQHWIEYLEKRRGTVEYSTAEKAVDKRSVSKMDVREKLVELIFNADSDKNLGWYDLYDLTHEKTGCAEYFADYLIANGVTVQEWISVEDRLPDDENQRVLAVCVGDYPIGHPRIDTDRYTRGHWVRYGNDVTHWMPLPQPPKGE